MQSNIDDYFTKINYLINNIEVNLKKCSKKFKDKSEIDILYTDLSNFLVQENISDSKLQDELQAVEKELRKTNVYNEYSRRKLNEYKEKIKNLNIELKSIKTLLEKSSVNWSKFKESFELLKKWLDEQEKIADLSKTDLNGYQRFQKLHAQFAESSNFILQTSDASTSAKIKEKILSLNKSWKVYQDRFKDTQYDQFLKYYECEQSLNMIVERLSKIESLTQKQCKCNLSAVNKYQEELQKAFNDVECLDANLKLLDKLITRLDLRHDPSLQVNDLYSGVKFSEAKLERIREIMPDFLRNLTKTCTQISSIEEGLQQIEYWVIEGENLLKSDPDQLNFDQIIKHIEKQKKHFNEFTYHENSIANKTHSLQSLKTLAMPNFDYTDLSHKLFRVKELLQNLNRRRMKWEELFQAQQSLWRSFHQKTKILEEWIMNAQRIVSEKNDDYNFLLHKHKAFFDNVDNDLINGFLKAGQPLLHIKNESDTAEIKNLMDNLSGQWKMILTHAPVRLLKLQFKRLEVLLKQELKAADIEISEECLALNKNVDLNEILRRHEAKFKHSNFFSTCESYLQGLRTCTKELSEKKVEDKSNVEEILEYLQNYWMNLTKKIETMNQKLTILPDTKENFERSYNQFVTWLYELEQQLESLNNNNLSSLSEYKRLVEKCRSSLSELDSKQEQFSILINQYDYLSEQNLLSNEIGAQLDGIKQRYIIIIESETTIRNRIKYIEQIVVLANNSDILANKIRNLSALSARRFMAEEDDNSIQTAIQEHHTVIDQMRLFEEQINSLKQEACKISDNNLLHLPVCIYEKIVSTQDAIKQNLSEELERQSSLMEIKQLTETKLNKMDNLTQSVALINTIVNTKNPEDLANELNLKSSESYQEETINLNDAEYSKYLLYLSKGRGLINTSKCIINELKSSITNVSGSNSPVPSFNGYHELREIELQVDIFSQEIESQIDHFENNLSANQKLNRTMDKLNNNLNALKENFNMYDLKSLSKDENNKESMVNLEVEYDKLRIDLEQINRLKCELNAFHYDRVDLIKSNSFNLNQCKIGTLCQGFNEVIVELDMKKDSIYNEKIQSITNDVAKIEEKCLLKISEIKFEIEQFKELTKQTKLDELKDTLDLELDNLVNLKYFNEDDDLLIESEDILLDRGSMNGDDTQMDIYFNKTTEIDIDQECFHDESNQLEEKCVVDVRVSRECLETNYNTSLDGESFNMIKQTDSQLRNSREALDHETDKPNDAIELQNTAVTRGIADEQSSDEYVQIEIEREAALKKSVTFAEDSDLLEVNRFERVSRSDDSEESKSGWMTSNKILEMEEFELLERESLEMENLESQEDTEQEQLQNILKQKEFQRQSRETERNRMEMERLEKERIEYERAEDRKRELERLENERKERERLELERSEARRVELERLEVERLERERLEHERSELEKLERERKERDEEIERQRLEQEAIELEKKRVQDMLEKQKIEQETREREALEQKLIQKEQMKKEREKERQRQEAERIEKEKEMVQRRLANQRIEAEKFEIERKEKERLLKEKEEAEIKRIEQERVEMEQAIKQRELERLEMDRLLKEREKAEKERIEREKNEREEMNRQKEKLEQEIIKVKILERENVEKLRQEKIQEKKRLEKERLEQEAALKLENERLEQERAERERLQRAAEKHRVEKEILAKQNELLEKEKRSLEAERIERAKSNEMERIEWERIEQQRIDWERKQLYEQNSVREQKELMSRRLPAVKEEDEEDQLNKSVASRSFYDCDDQVESTYHIDLDDNKAIEAMSEHDTAKKSKMESDLKNICENFNYLKEKINQVGELGQNEEDTKLLVSSLEKELKFLNIEVDDLSITCGLALEGSSCNSLDQATLTQFDLIKSFSCYLGNQLDDKKREFLQSLNKRAHVEECEKNLIKYIELALKFYKPTDSYLDWLEKDLKIKLETNTVTYVESLSDIESRINSIESIEDSIGNCLKQRNDVNFDASSTKLNQRLIESNVLHPLSTHCADLKKFAIEWKQFDTEFTKLKSFLSNEIRIEHLLKNGADLNSELEEKLKSNFVGFVEKDLKKYTVIREKLINKVAESEQLFSQGSALFDAAYGHRLCVMVPNAAKEFKETRCLIKEACRFLDEKCSCYKYVLKSQDKIKDLLSGLNHVIADLDHLEDDQIYMKLDSNDLSKTEACLSKAKCNLENLASLKLRFKSIGEEKDSLTECSANKMNTVGTSLPNSNISNSNLEAFNRKFNFESRQTLEKSFNEVSLRFASLEVQYQEEIMKTLPSRSALNELVDWLRIRIELVDSLSNRIGTEKCNSLEHLESYKKNLCEINQEMKQGRESSLKFLRNSIEDEIKQGFYDLAVSELLAKTERDWNKLGQRISNDLERLDLSLIRINEFDRNVRQMQVWIQNQTVMDVPSVDPNQAVLIDDINSLSIIDDDKRILAQINNYKELLSRLDVIWQQERKELHNSENSKVGQLVQRHMCKNLDELKSNLQSMELISKLKIENNLTSIKQTYTIEINELNASLESEVNFINFGKIVSRQQYETTIQKISDILKKLGDTRSKMQTILNKFDADLKSSKIDMNINTKLNHQDVLSIAKNTIDAYDTTGLLDNLKKNNTFNLNNLHLESLEKTAQQLISQAQKNILPVWVKYDEAYSCLQVKINETNRSYVNDLENIENIDVSNSNLFQDKLKEMMENRRLFDQFNTTSNYLIEKFAPNENTKTQLKQNKQGLQDQFEKLSVLADKLKTKYESSLIEHQNFTKLITETNNLNEEAIKVINMFNIDSANKVRNLRSYTAKLEELETRLKNTLDKFKSLNIKDTERISKIYETTTPCGNLMAKIHDCRLSIIDCVQERQNLVQSKLIDIERYLETYQTKRSEESILLTESLNSHENYIQNKNLNKLINCIKYMLAHNITLSKYESQLEEFINDEANLNDEALYTKLKSLRNEKIHKFRKQINLVSSSPDGLYDNLTALNCLNDQLNNTLEQNMENNMKNIDKFQVYNEKFQKLRREIEKNIFELQEHGLCFIDFRAMKANCLDPIENFYIKIVSDIETVSSKVERYHMMASQLDKSLYDVESKLKSNSKTNACNKPNDSENLEKRLTYLKSIKSYLSSMQLKTDIEIVQQLGSQLQQRGLIELIQKHHMENDKPQYHHEAIRIKYLDLTCLVDMEIKDNEQEFSKWKSIVTKSSKLLDLIRHTHEQLAKISLSNKCDRINSTEITNTSSLLNTSELLNQNIFDELSTNSLDYKVELKDNKTLNHLIDFLKFDVLSNLEEHESLKQEIIDLSIKASTRSNSIKAIVDNVLVEWKLVIDKTHTKIIKLERFKGSLNNLDSKLNKVREQIFGWETYLNQECFGNLDLVSFDQIIGKKAELENLLESLKKRDNENQSLFKLCLNANRHNGNRQNQLLITNIKDRWTSLKTVTKEKLYLIQNLWIMLCDLNDQIEKFYMVLEKTETFYQSTLQVGNNPNYMFKLIQELYLTIQDDFKLIKYLNESFVNFSKLANYFSCFELLNKMKQKFMAINGEWDNLHNEIAVKIKNTRKYENQIVSSDCFLTKDKIITWISEIHLLITNLEHLSTNELQYKFDDVVALKKEVLEHTELIFKNENILKNDDNLIERIKDVMKRIIRLDSYLKHSTALPPPPPVKKQVHIEDKPNFMPDKPAFMESFESLF